MHTEGRSGQVTVLYIYVPLGLAIARKSLMVGMIEKTFQMVCVYMLVWWKGAKKVGQLGCKV
jgi:hypothetical protein